MAWWYLVVYIVALIIAVATMPKPETQPPPGMGEVKSPTAEEGLEIPVLFGTRVFYGANVVWYGDVKAVAIVKSGGKK